MQVSIRAGRPLERADAERRSGAVVISQVVLLVLGASVVPAERAARMDPIEALQPLE